MARPSAVAAALSAAALLVAHAGPSRAGAFIFADEGDEDVITHPKAYTGAGGSLSLDVCIVAGSPNQSEMGPSIEAAVATWSQLAPIGPSGTNLYLGPSNDIPSGGVDFESSLLHELGHCGLGLAHPNLATESGVAMEDQNYTKSTNGAGAGPMAYDLDPGGDAVKGSRDDLRGDDANLHWFKKADNHPFSPLPAIVDATTYSRSLADLPPGDTYAANADRQVAGSLGLGTDIESVMNQGTLFDEAQRLLVADDVATARLGMAGLDGIQGTADDYTLTLQFIGVAAGCDVEVSFDDAETGFAVCQASAAGLSPDHVRIANAEIFFNTGFNWHFRPECGDGSVEGLEECDDGGTAPGDGCDASCEIETGWTCSGQPSTCSTICGDGLLLGGEQCDDGNNLPGDCCSAFCAFEPPGFPCDDGDACSDPDTCDGAATCQPGPPLVCDDANVCTDDSCDPSTGCVFTSNTAPCDDGDACTTADTCAGGACLGGPPLACDDANVCTDDSCDPGSGCVFANNTAPCDDGLACTDPDTCSGGSCSGPPLACDDADPCTADSCDELSGCVHDPIPGCGAPAVPSTSAWGRGLLGLLVALAGGIWIRTRPRSGRSGDARV